MKIDTANVQLSSSQTATRTQTQVFHLETSFRSVLASETQSLADQAAEGRERVARLLQSMVESILAAVQGKCGTTEKSDDSLLTCAGAKDEVPSEAPSASGGGRELSWQLMRQVSVSEMACSTVSACGTVRTQDGREIAFDLTVDRESLHVYEQTTIEAGSIVLQDPLVLNFSGTAKELSGQTMAFDLDADGQVEQVPCLSEGCGFLVFDRNHNGQADDGSELFGPRSGQGFQELSALDGDHNGWIDENDAVFGDLALWSGERWQSLKEAGVGALYTQSVEAPFTLRGDTQEVLGEIRAAGIFLAESGTVGSLTQIDLAVSDAASAAAAGANEPEQGERLAA